MFNDTIGTVDTGRLGTGRLGLAGLALAGCLAAAPLTSTAATAQEIVVTVSSVRATSRIDATSAADFLARVTIAGETKTSEHIRNRNFIRPNWVFRQKVKPGVHKVKLEILDKDLTKDEPIDINRLPGKRDLDFEVDTRSCDIVGFAKRYRCKTTIRRAGVSGKRAEVTFRVDVRK